VLALVLDAFVIMFLVRVFGDFEELGCLTAGLAAFGIGLISGLGVAFALNAFPPVVALVTLLPIVAGAAWLIMWAVCRLPPKEAVYAALCFLGYKAVFYAIIFAAFGTGQ